MSYVVYSDSDAIQKVDGITYRKLSQFYGVVAGTVGVYVDGEAPVIVATYQAAGVEILAELPTSPKLPVPGVAAGWADITGKPELLTLGATADTAAAGNHNHAITANAASGLVAAANIQAGFQAISARVKALEDAAAAG